MLVCFKSLPSDLKTIINSVIFKCRLKTLITCHGTRGGASDEACSMASVVARLATEGTLPDWTGPHDRQVAGIRREMMRTVRESGR